MTNKEFFITTIKHEHPVFIKILKAIPPDKLAFTPAEKARTTGRVAFQLANQWRFIRGIVRDGKPDWEGYTTPTEPPLEEIINLAEKNFAELIAVLAECTDTEWENGVAILTHPGGAWETKKYDMAWGFLFDAIHHRGQLTTYLRVMGAKVPSVYGGSADEPVG